MKRIQVVAVALVAIFAIGAVAVASASAVEFLLALWLEGGMNVTSPLSVENEGEFELKELNGGNFGVHVKVLCSGIFDGLVGAESLAFISELLILGGTRRIPATVLTGEALLCTNLEGCTEPEMWMAGAGWEAEVELMIDVATFFADLILSGGWYLQCLILGMTTSETCTANETVAQVTNEAGGVVDAEFSGAFQELAGLKLDTCTLGGAESGELSGLITILEAGVTLAVSSE
jgi:hypothetical protein